MAIEIPQGGFKTIDSAANAISGIMNRPIPGTEEAAENEPTSDDGKLTPSIPESANERENQDSEPSDQDVAAIEQSGESEVDTEVGEDQDAAVASGEGEPAEEPETQEVEYDHAALAQALGISEDDLIIEESGISVRTKINGEESATTLEDLRNSYQMTSAAQKSMQEVAQEKKQFQETKKAQLEDLNNQAQFMRQAIYSMEQMYLNDHRNVNWEQLRESDPDEYNVRRLDFQEREKHLKQWKEQYTQAQQQIQQEWYSEMQEVWNEGAKMLNNTFMAPEYKTSPKWGQEEQDRLIKWMVNEGIPNEVVNTIGAWQVFKWARDSMLRKEEQAAAKKTMKKVVKLPKVKTAKPGTPKTESTKRRSKVEEAKRRQVTASRKGQKNFNQTVDLISEMMKQQ